MKNREMSTCLGDEDNEEEERDIEVARCPF
jgi:hypothetical protein